MLKYFNNIVHLPEIYIKKFVDILDILEHFLDIAETLSKQFRHFGTIYTNFKAFSNIF